MRNVEDEQAIIISIMDEGPASLNEMSLIALHDLRLGADLKGKSRWSYATMAIKGTGEVAPIEKLDQDLIDISFPNGSCLGSIYLPFDLRTISAGFTVGNTSSILINGIEYSQQRRGMNIVVYDLDKNKVVSSVNFDTHVTNYN